MFPRTIIQFKRHDDSDEFRKDRDCQELYIIAAHWYDSIGIMPIWESDAPSKPPHPWPGE